MSTKNTEKKTDVEEVLQEFSKKVTQSLTNEVVSNLLREDLNIHIPEPLRTEVINWVAGDESKIKTLIRYSNIAGISGIRQLIKL